MSLDTITNLFQFHLLFKLLLLVGSLFYFVLTLVIYRQVTSLTQTLDSAISPLIIRVAVIQIVVVGVFFFVVMLLA